MSLEHLILEQQTIVSLLVKKYYPRLNNSYIRWIKTIPMKYFLILFLPFLCFCTRDDHSEITVISGHILNVEADSQTQISLVYSSFGSTEVKKCMLSSSGELYETISIHHLTDVYLKFNRQKLKFFVQPGDSVHIEAKLDSTFSNVIFGGDFEQQNRELQELVPKCLTYLRSYGKKRYAIPENDFKTLIDLVLNHSRKGDEFVDSITANKNYHYEVIQWAKNYLKYEVSFDLTNYSGESNQAISTAIDSLLPSDYDVISCSSFWSSFIPGYIVSQFRGIYGDKTHLPMSKVFEEVSVDKSQIVTELLYCHLFKTLVNQGISSPSEMIEVFPEIRKAISTNSGLNYVDDCYSDYIARDSYFPELHYEDVKFYNGFEDIPFESIGKDFVFIKVWADWCGPCIKEIPSYTALQRYYAKSNIGFATLALHSDSSKLVNLVTKHKVPGFHYFIAPEYSDELMSKLEFNTIPHFLILKKSGEVIVNSAPSPNTREVFDALDRLK